MYSLNEGNWGSNMRTIHIWILVIGLNAVWAQTSDSLTGHWKFDDPDNLSASTVGADLVLVGSHNSVAGPDSSNGAAYVGVGSHYIASHGIAPNGGGVSVNEFTLVMDIKIPSLGKWYVLYQSDIDNSDDGEWAIDPTGQVGIAATGYSEPIIEPNEWYRFAIAVKSGYRYDYYLDGNLLRAGYPQTVDGRFSLDSSVLLLADENGEDNPLNVAEVMIFDQALDDDEIRALGGFGHEYEVSIDTLFHTYLQTPTPNSIYVSYHTRYDTETQVEYGTTEALGQSQTGEAHIFNDQIIWNWAKLTGLTPATVYHYRVVVDTFESEIKKFKTPPQYGSNDGHIRFAVMGDTQQNFTIHTQVVNKMQEKLLELYGEGLESALNCVIHVGDIVDNGDILPSFKIEYFNPIAPVSGYVPYMVSIGNHERDSENYFHYMKYEDIGGPQGERYYSFKLGRLLFISINSNSPYTNQTQVAWLESLLQDASTDTTIDWIFAFSHHPWRSELWVDGNSAYVKDEIVPLLKEYDVDLHMHGHTHAYQRGAVPDANLRLLQSGGGAGNIDRWGEFRNENYPEVLKSIDHHHYTIFDLDVSNKKYTATTYSLGNTDLHLDNVIIDQFFRDKADTTLPDTPTILFPAPGSKIDSVVALRASPFSGNGDLMSSQFQITANEGDYSTPIFNVIRNYMDIYGDTGSPAWQPVDLNADLDITELTVPEVLLWTEATYWWKVRYRNRNLQWSDWSDEGRFITAPLGTTDEDKAAVLPKSTKLFNNYPNPFNSTTTIKFQLSNQGQVSLNIYDSAGLLVKRLINETRTAGEYEVQWDGTNDLNRTVASGAYFIQIKTGNYQRVTKALLLK